MAAPDEGKLTEPICFKASERLACDILRAATRDGCGLAEWVRNLVRQELYGRMVLDAAKNGEQSSGDEGR